MRVPNRFVAHSGGGTREALSRLFGRFRPAIRKGLGRSRPARGPLAGGRRRRALTPRGVAVTGFAVGVLLAMAFLTGTSSGGWLLGLQRAAGLSRAPDSAATPVTSPAAGPMDGLADDATNSPAVFEPSSAPDSDASGTDSGEATSRTPVVVASPGSPRRSSASRRTPGTTSALRSSPSARGPSPSSRPARGLKSAAANGTSAPASRMPRPAPPPSPDSAGPSGSSGSSGSGGSGGSGPGGRGGTLGLLGL